MPTSRCDSGARGRTRRGRPSQVARTTPSASGRATYSVPLGTSTTTPATTVAVPASSVTSTAMLTDKMTSVLSTGAEVVTAGDASCLMHIGGGLHRLRSGVRAVHLAEILAATRENPLEVDGPVELSIPASAGARRGPSARVEEARR